MAIDDPLLDPDYRYALNRFEGDGSKILWDLTFAGGFISRDHVKAYLEQPDGSLTELGFTWQSNSTVSVTPPVADGQGFIFYRDTPKNAPLVDFNGGSAFTETNLDTLAKQAVFAAAETIDRFAGVEDRTTAATAAAAAAGVVAQAADDKAELAINDALEALETANAASAQASGTAAEFDALVETVEDLVGSDLTGLARLDTEQVWTEAQQFRAGLAAFSADGSIGSELLPDGTYRLYHGGSWHTPVSWHSWAAITGKPSVFPPASHTQPWGTITEKPTEFNPTAHQHDWSEVTGRPSTYPPSAHNQDWSTITGAPAFKPIIFSTAAPSGGVDGDVWLRYV